MRILALDIETSPNVVHTWGLFNQNVGLNQIIRTSEIICFAARFLDEPKKAMRFYSLNESSREEMILAAWELLDEADVVLHYNGKRFDMPHLNREFIELGLKPPSPYQEIDLYLVAKRRFRFQSNRMQHVATQLSLEGKVEHEGFDLWLRCLNWEADAWRKMEKYNRRDVELLVELYGLMRPWVPSHPGMNLATKGHACPYCASTKLQRRGVARTRQSEYQRYQCQKCGGWSRGTHRSKGVHVVGVT